MALYQGTTRRIIAANNSAYGVNVYGNDTIADDRRICMWDNSEGVTLAQKWYIGSHYDGWAIIRSEINRNYVLSKDPSSNAVKAYLLADDGNETLKNGQLWNTHTLQDGTGRYYISLAIDESHQTKRCLTRAGNYNNATLTVETYAGLDNQLWSDVQY